jgi:hypothetical protein
MRLEKEKVSSVSTMFPSGINRTFRETRQPWKTIALFVLSHMERKQLSLLLALISIVEVR